jgi:choline dehydrogenase-like flavoprotein
MTHYDVAVIGTGAGGGTLVNRLALAGLSVLVLERGGFLPSENANWDASEVFEKQRYV